MIRTYKNIDAFLNEKGIDKFAGESGHKLSYSTIVRALDYNACKEILLNQLKIDKISIDILKQRYEQDKHLNNIYKKNSAGTWTWDIIGDRMIHNPKATVRFILMSDCSRTRIAKACARMILADK